MYWFDLQYFLIFIFYSCSSCWGWHLSRTAGNSESTYQSISDCMQRTNWWCWGHGGLQTAGLWVIGGSESGSFTVSPCHLHTSECFTTNVLCCVRFNSIAPKGVLGFGWSCEGYEESLQDCPVVGTMNCSPNNINSIIAISCGGTDSEVRSDNRS